mmetsp:Transcript_17662/g.31965  ORF Transcript_17662/g.31965 Transcript_17662/m.31965 type:complete len:330 (+) Transcript_17662:190-1179(+)
MAVPPALPPPAQLDAVKGAMGTDVDGQDPTPTSSPWRSPEQRVGLRPPQGSGDSLNNDPFNVHAEELAMQDCMNGEAVRRVWAEKEMVRSIDGYYFPGTPDGMFENWDGALICVQVVRVPLLPELCVADMHITLAQTILTKVVKSQHWLRASHVIPKDFIIYCWLPFALPDEVAMEAEALMSKVRLFDARFSLRLRVPASPGSLFPALFACNFDAQRQGRRGYSWSDVTTFPDSEESRSDDDDFCEWDITWSWDDAVPADAAAAETDDSDLLREADVEVDWDIAWGPLDTCTVVGNHCDLSAGCPGAMELADCSAEPRSNYVLLHDDGG